MVAVVVPSPAMSLVFCATALTSLAPMFSNGSGRSISLLTVTPSLVTVGPPKLLSRITLRPVGPSVIPTAWASLSAPESSFFRASSVYSNCFAIVSYPSSGGGRGPAPVLRSRPAVRSRSLGDLGQDVGFTHDLEVLAVDLDLVAAVAAVDDLVAYLHRQSGACPGVRQL